MFDKYRDFSDIILFTGIDCTRLLKLANGKILCSNSSEVIASDLLTAQFIILDEQSHLEQIWNKTTRPVHLLRYEGNDQDMSFSWIQSKGDMTSYFLNLGEDHEVSEKWIFEKLDKEFDIDNQLICISGSDKVSSSVYIAHLSTRLARTYLGRNVLYLGAADFANLTKRYGNQAETISFRDAISLVLTDELGITQDTRVELLLDLFDTLKGGPNEELLGQILTTVKSSFKHVHLWMVSRDRDPHFGSGTNHLCYKLKSPSKQDQVGFLTEFWSRRGAPDKEKLGSFIQDKLVVLNGDGLFDKSFLTKLLAETYAKEAEEYAQFGENPGPESSSHEIGNFSTGKLYQAWTNNKFEGYKLSSRTANGTLNDKQLMSMHIKLSLDYLFPDPDQFHKLKSLFDPVPVNLEEIFKVGLVEGFSRTGLQPRFVDQFIPEYFVARLVTDNLKGEGDWGYWEENIVAKFILEGALACVSQSVSRPPTWNGIDSFQFSFPGIGYFVNHFMAEVDVSTLPIGSLFKFGVGNPTEVIYKLGHACANSGFLELFNYFIENFPVYSSFPGKLADAQFVYLTITKSSLDFVKMAWTQLEKSQNLLSSEIQFNTLRMASYRGDPQIVKFLIEQKELAKIVGNLEQETRKLLHDCVEGSKDKSSQELEGFIEVARLLVPLNRGMIEEKDNLGRTPLLLEELPFPLKMELIKVGADTFAQDSYNNTVLHNMRNGGGGGHITPEEYLSLLRAIPEDQLRKLVSVKTRLEMCTPLMSVVKGMDPSRELLRRFKDLGADFNSVGLNPSGGDSVYQNTSLLGAAIIRGRGMATLQNIIELGGDVDWKGVGGEGLLHIAAQEGMLEAVHYLVEKHGADGNATDKEGLTPLNYAMRKTWTCKNCLETGLALKKLGGTFKSIVDSKGRPSFHVAAEEGDLQSVILHLGLGADVSGRDPMGNTPLHLGVTRTTPFLSPFIHKCYFPITAFLLQNGGDPTALNSGGHLPFQVALTNDELDLETFLLLKAKTGGKMRWTPVHATSGLVILVKTGNVEKFDLLARELEGHAGNFSHIIDSSGDSLLHLAALHRNPRAVRFLVEEKGAEVNINSTNLEQKTALHLGAVSSEIGVDLSIIEFLIDNGANVYGKDEQGHTFLHNYMNGYPRPSVSQLHSLVEHLARRNLSDIFQIRKGWMVKVPIKLESL